MLRGTTVIAAIACIAIVALPVAAHHSFQAEYDGSKVVIIKGVVKKVAWVNPHAYVYVESTGADGKITNWAFESLSPNALSIRGWSRNSLKEGDQVTVEAYLAKDGKPLADGSLHANSRLITLADGRKVFAGSSADDESTKSDDAVLLSPASYRRMRLRPAVRFENFLQISFRSTRTRRTRAQDAGR